uniref:Uncharacterized protein n=1 Tax=Trichobilharzia regenti TaxID=157069 RepID=A0AA85ITH4_TRIRE|nr:unnamed protein product [Trichobilharzia regenti]
MVFASSSLEQEAHEITSFYGVKKDHWNCISLFEGQAICLNLTFNCGIALPHVARCVTLGDDQVFSPTY